MVEFESDEGPGAAGDVPEPFGGGGHGDHGRCRVVGADGDDGEPGWQAVVGRHLVVDGTEGEARFPHRRQEAGWDPRRVRQFGRPAAGADVEQLGGGGVGDLGDAFAGQPVAQQVRDEQERPGVVELGAAGPRPQLDEGVDRHELDAGDVVDPFGRDVVEQFGQDVLGPGVPVVEGGAQQGPLCVQQAVVHRPGVDADAGQRRPAELGGGGEAAQRPLVEAEDVPVQSGHPGAVHGADGVVGEPGRLGDGELTAADPAQQHPAAGGAQVHGGAVHGSARCRVAGGPGGRHRVLLSSQGGGAPGPVPRRARRVGCRPPWGRWSRWLPPAASGRRPWWVGSDEPAPGGPGHGLDGCLHAESVAHAPDPAAQGPV